MSIGMYDCLQLQRSTDFRNITVLKDISISLKHTDVLVVEDMLDTGLTLQYILGHLKQKDAKSVRICTFI